MEEVYYIFNNSIEESLELRDIISFLIQIVQTLALIITILVTIYSTRKMNKATYDSTKEMIKDNLKRSFHDQLDSILKISIEYPQLESDEIVKSWKEKSESKEEIYIRYDLYCTLIFNLGERVSVFFNFDDEEINKFINFRDWINYHKDYWIYSISPDEDKNSYKKKYIDLIKKWIK